MTTFRKQQLACKLATPAMLLVAGGITYAHYYPTYIKPCSNPIEYSIGSFDPRFQISRTEFLSAVSAAEAIWEEPTGQNLFEYNPNAPMKINLIYDYRQEATDRLTSLGYKIENTQSSYNTLKARYDSLLPQYEQQKAVLDSLIKQFQTRKAAYDEQVDYWNQQGGAPKETAQSLNAEHDALIKLAAKIKAQEKIVNDTVADINKLVEVLNNLAAQLKLNVSNYNTVGQTRGEEFAEGLFIQDATGKTINIYEFNQRDELIRVLAHEMGHALGLEHVDDADSIMYHLNESENAVLTAADKDQLKLVCGF